MLMAGCGPSLSGAKSDFKGGKVAEAKETLVALEAESRSWPPPKRAQYVLYRGLVHQALGDREEALRWLREAKTIVATHSGALSEDDRTRLEIALDTLGGP